MLCVAGGKGGVGKTTTAVGLARAAVTAGVRSVVVDADRDCPDLAHVVGVSAHGLSAFADGRDLDACGSNACGSNAGGVRYIGATGRESGGTVRRALERLRRSRVVRKVDGPVLVDAPTGGGRDAALPLRLSDRAVVVAIPTAPALRDAVKTTEMARALDAAVAGAVYVRGIPGNDPLTCQTLATVPTTCQPLVDDRGMGSLSDV